MRPSPSADPAAPPPARRRAGLRAALATALALAALLPGLGLHYEAQLAAADRARAASEVRAQAGALEAVIAQRFALVVGLRAFVESDFDRALDPAHVDPFASAIHLGAPGVRALQIIRGGIIRYTFPLAGNERALGRDLAHDPRGEVREDFLRAERSRALEVSGPFQLIQGGTGLVARQAVLRDGALWGVVAMVLDLPALLDQAGVTRGRAGLVLTLRDARGRVFFGASGTSGDEPVVAPVALPQGAWQVAAAPEGGRWGRGARGVLVRLALLGLAVTVLVPVLVGLLVSRRAQRRAFAHALERKEIDTWKRAIRVIGHEIGNSMGPIASLVRSARSIVANQGKAALLPGIFDTIEERARHLVGFLDRYAALARLPPPKIGPVSFGPFVDALRPLYPFAVAGPLPEAPGAFDEAQVQQVVINLLKNAAEAGGPPEEIRLEVRAGAGQVEIAVHDRGVGLDPQAIARAGEPFFTTKLRGTGLGLLLCREIAAGHGGTLHLEPRPGGGATARLVLPQPR